MFDRKSDDTAELRKILKAVAVESGGLQWLSVALDVAPSLISRAFNGVDGYEINVRHISALLDEPSFAALFVRWLCLRTGHEPPVKRRPDRSAAEKLAALTKALRKSGKLGAAALEEAASDLDIEPDCF